MSAELTISGLTIVADNAPAIYVEAGAALNLTVEGENLLTGDDGFAGICVEPGWDQSGSFSPEASGRLVIQGMGSLSAQGGDAVSDAGHRRRRGHRLQRLRAPGILTAATSA